MITALFWGTIAASSLILGALLAFWLRVGSRTLGLIMGFGAGVLISAVAYELAQEAFEKAEGSGMAALGLFAGAFTFFLGDALIDNMGGHNRKGIKKAHPPNLGLPITLGIILDGIPESMVIGLSLLGGMKVGLTMLLAVFLSNLPETIAATTSLLAGGWKKHRILGLWVLVVVACGLAAMAGYGIFRHSPPSSVAFVQTFAGGAILVMLADTMMPHAFEHGGRWAGIMTTLGFGIAIFVSSLQ
jgi:ZIP family zinc transporter